MGNVFNDLVTKLEGWLAAVILLLPNFVAAVARRARRGPAGAARAARVLRGAAPHGTTPTVATCWPPSRTWA
jgi:hypothetical protein